MEIKTGLKKLIPEKLYKTKSEHKIYFTCFFLI